ncbi:hypothetical protein AB0M39_08055 [Streptomyces sp. NPDC051907]|uniref:hypothetical protein n=1 Tax=Streptomyces sp. NPDC051907 TaxID=3155284 RepID=UPI003437AB82
MRRELRALALGAVLPFATAMQLAQAEAPTVRPPGSGEGCTFTVSADGSSARCSALGVRVGIGIGVDGVSADIRDL